MSEFWCTEQDLISYLTANPRTLIGTLGPKGTSCDNALDYFLRDVENAGEHRRLIDEFDNIYTALNNEAVNIAMIPAAYTRATEFFWATELKFLGSVVYKTPDYHFAHAKGVTQPKRIATCAAVAHMLTDQFAHCADVPYELVIGPSTLAAADDVAAGKADACITNDNGLKKAELKVIHTQSGVDMCWLFFGKRT